MGFLFNYKSRKWWTVSSPHILWNESWRSVIVFKPTGTFFWFLLWPSHTCHLLPLMSWMWLCGRHLLEVRLSVTHLCTMWPSNKYICYPCVQFIELSEVSEPARPQKGPVRWEMEGELSGPPSLPHHCRKGISIRPDRLRRWYRWLMGNSTEAQPGERFCWQGIKSPCSTGSQY